MISCYIVDDELHAIRILSKYIEQTPGLVLQGYSENPLEALQVFREQGYAEITFIDGDMPQLTGVELSELISDKTATVFTTAYDRYALQAFEKDAFDYILKPISYERFLKCINRINSKKAKTSPVEETGYRDHFYIQYEVKGKIIKIEYKDVNYIQGLKNYVSIHTNDNKYITYLTLKEVEESLPPNLFVRIHKSSIINLDKIVTIDGNIVVLKDKEKTELTIGSSYKDSFLAMLDNKVLKTKRSPK